MPLPHVSAYFASSLDGFIAREDDGLDWQGLAEDVVEEMTISLIAVVLGRGIGLFASGLPESDWTLVSTESFPSGLAHIAYRRDRR